MIDTNLALVCHSELGSLNNSGNDDSNQIELVSRLIGNSKLSSSTLWKLLQQICSKFSSNVINSALQKCCIDSYNDDDHDHDNILTLLLQEAANSAYDNSTLILLSWCMSPSPSPSKPEIISKCLKKCNEKARLFNCLSTLSSKLPADIRNNVQMFVKQ